MSLMMTETPSRDSEYYILVVLEYANGENLKGYLNKNFVSMKWNDKIRMGCY
ncbi:hypothetical protein RhiirA4_471119 [Rhizophagus irregularis]|uniref:Serine-threonine/tyrosine-protein kinase catalytic domain-containing protein n=1 Tax=Rhizophagus irregularis TaxID=588596 RepID=A0A2I1H2H9_9GLOM|nr:hypothetical protein RhiirA4_471119 [Rhizophagus irregularis]